jgi:plasmid stability protein
MTTLTIRNLDEHTKEQLRIQATRHGRSMEEEARTILRSALEARPRGAGAT